MLKSSSNAGFLTLVLGSLFLVSLGMISHNAFAAQVIATIPVGGMPEDVAVNPITNMIYVTNYAGNTVSVINGSTDSVVSTIPVGSHPVFAQVNPVTGKVYVSNSFSYSISVIDGATNTVKSTITGVHPYGIGINQNTDMVYVACQYCNDVYVIDGTNDTVVKTLSGRYHNDAAGVNPDTNTIYVSGAYTGTIGGITIVNGTTNSITGYINYGGNSFYVGVNPNTNKFYVSDYESGIVYVIDGRTNSIASKISGFANSYGVAVNPVTNKVYVADEGSSTISIIDGTTNSITSTIPVGGNPWGVGVNPNTDKIYVANSGSNTVSVIDDSSSSGTSSNTTAPSAPQNLQATAGHVQVSLSWSTPSSNGGSSITNYNVYRGTSSGSETLLATIGNVTSYTDTTVTNGQTYFYKVTAVNSAGESPQSNEAGAIPAAPSGSGSTSGIVLKNVQSTSGTTDSSNQITLSNFNATAGTDRLLVVGVSANNNDVGSIIFAGVPLTREISHFTNNDAEFWYLANPTGSGDITATMNGPTQAVVGAYSFSGVNQTVPIPTHITRHNLAPSSPAISITTQYPNDLVLDLPSIYGGSTLGSPTCIQQWDLNVPNQITGASSSMIVPSPATVTCSWTASSDDMWDDAAIELRAAG